VAPKVTLVSLAQGAILLTLAVGCSSGPLFGGKQGIQSSMFPSQTAKPGPVKQLAAKVGDSSVGRSVSKLFKTASAKKPKPAVNDPVSLARKVKKPDADFYVDAGDWCVKGNNIEGARENYHRALEMKRHHLGALLGLARLFDRQGQLERATEHYLEAVEHHPKEAIAFNDLGLCYARRQKYDEALAALNRAVELQPDRVLYRNNIATVLVVQGRIDEALAHLTDVHGAAVAHYNIGFLLNRRGQRAQALDQFALALKADPSMNAAQQWIDSLSSEMVADNRQQVQTASDLQSSDPADGASAGGEPVQGPELGVSEEPASEEIPAGEPETHRRTAFHQQLPSNRLRDAEPADASAPESVEPESETRSLPGTPAEATAEPEQGRATPGVNDGAETANDTEEPRLRYLPPVTKRNAKPSRY
jgi:tetratricopeptide (TPR) repeat protein